MKNLFPRKKPFPVPKIQVTPEYMAKGRLKESYSSTKSAFDVPWMGVVAMAFAKYPHFYNTLWKYMYLLSKSNEFNNKFISNFEGECPKKKIEFIYLIQPCATVNNHLELP